MLNFLFYCALFSLSLGQLAAFSKGSGLNIYLFDIVIGLFSLYGFIYFMVVKKIRLPKYLLLYFAFAFIAILSLVPATSVLSTEQLLVSSFYGVRFVIYLLAGVVIYNMLHAKIISPRELFIAILVSGVFVALMGFFQLVLLPDFETIDSSLGWDPHKNRLLSTFYDPNFVGGYLAICLAVVFHVIFDDKKILPGYFKYFAAFILATALFLTFSRSAWLNFAVIVFVFGVFKSRWLLVTAVILAFLAYFAVPRVQTRIAGITDPADSAQHRFTSWENTLEIAEDNLLLGVGFNAYRYAQQAYGFIATGTLGGHSGAGSDSSFLFVLAATGLVGFIVFLCAYFYPPMNSFYRKSPYRVLMVAFLGGLLLQSQFINAFFYPQILFLTTTLLVNDS